MARPLLSVSVPPATVLDDGVVEVALGRRQNRWGIVWIGRAKGGSTPTRPSVGHAFVLDHVVAPAFELFRGQPLDPEVVSPAEVARFISFVTLSLGVLILILLGVGVGLLGRALTGR